MIASFRFFSLQLKTCFTPSEEIRGKHAKSRDTWWSSEENRLNCGWLQTQFEAVILYLNAFSHSSGKAMEVEILNHFGGRY